MLNSSRNMRIFLPAISCALFAGCGGSSDESLDLQSIDDAINAEVSPSDAVVDAPDATQNDRDTGAMDSAVAVDANPSGCSGPCWHGHDVQKCSDDGQGICFCNDFDQWAVTDCAVVCADYTMVPTGCTSNGDMVDCGCEFDCSTPEFVDAQCQNRFATPCTCASSDPCGFRGDGWCASLCDILYPEDPLNDFDECECSGSCSDGESQDFCDNSGGACRCVNNRYVSLNCEAICQGFGGTTSPKWCDIPDGRKPFCVCEGLDCEDDAGVQEQCHAMQYTECTCAASDPCGWVFDDYCDTHYCQAIFPDLETFDDTLTYACM